MNNEIFQSAARKSRQGIFEVGELFCSWSFLENFFFSELGIEWSIRISNWFFGGGRGVAPKNGPKLEKVGLETQKITLKLE